MFSETEKLRAKRRRLLKRIPSSGKESGYARTVDTFTRGYVSID
jgi:hypothetical protein